MQVINPFSREKRVQFKIAAAFFLIWISIGPVSAQQMLEDMTWKKVELALKSGTDSAIITIGATEQHGPQLPLASDSITGDCLAQEIAERAGRTLITPNIRLGISPHHMHFPGTITVRSEVLKSLVYEYVHSLAWHGLRHIFIIPTHGTNFGMAGELEVELSKLYPHINIFSFSDAEAYIKTLIDTSRRLGIDLAEAGSHSGLSETSMILACRGELVDMESAEVGFMGDAYAMGEKLNRDGTHSISPIGVLGDPRKASAKAGKEYLAGLATLLTDYMLERRSAWQAKPPADLPGGGLAAPEGELAEAINARRSGDFKKARRLLMEKSKKHQDDAMVSIEIARLEMLEDKYPAAIKRLEALLAGKHGNEIVEEIHDDLALAYLYPGKFSVATEHKLKARQLRAIANDPVGEGFKLFYVAYYQIGTGKIEQALESYQQALELAPDVSVINLDIEHLTGLAEVQLGRLLNAAQRLRVIGDALRDPQYSAQVRRFYHLNGELLLKLERPADAIVNFKSAIGVYDHPLYRESLARAYWGNGDISAAISELEKVVKLADARLDVPIHYVKAHYQLGQLYEAQGNTKKAREWYQRFLDFWDTSDTQLEEINQARKKVGA